MRNKYYTTDQAQFWSFRYPHLVLFPFYIYPFNLIINSFDQMAQFDLPTSVDFVLKTAGVSKLSYIGHSEARTLPLPPPHTNKRNWFRGL